MPQRLWKTGSLKVFWLGKNSVRTINVQSSTCRIREIWHIHVFDTFDWYVGWNKNVVVYTHNHVLFTYTFYAIENKMTEVTCLWKKVSQLESGTKMGLFPISKNKSIKPFVADAMMYQAIRKEKAHCNNNPQSKSGPHPTIPLEKMTHKRKKCIWK